MPRREPRESSTACAGRPDAARCHREQTRTGKRAAGVPLHAHNSAGTQSSPRRRHEALTPSSSTHTRAGTSPRRGSRPRRARGPSAPDHQAGATEGPSAGSSAELPRPCIPAPFLLGWLISSDFPDSDR